MKGIYPASKAADGKEEASVDAIDDSDSVVDSEFLSLTSDSATITKAVEGGVLIPVGKVGPGVK